ncbi:hypothetical protein D210916BOD24_29900 [Alteromonas sp. D210916BOD_24]|uniref:ABC transporter ATP-binding protein/permease n=1 Tax=Alteromonas sp. D210916BOD_24 TaxID=3157618 RepID=UPI00399CC441
MSKEKIPNRQTLSHWCKDIDGAHSLGLRTSQTFLVLTKCLSLFSLIIGFYYFSAIAHAWVVDVKPTNSEDIAGLTLCLSLSWVFQGVFNQLAIQSKGAVLTKLEHGLLQVLALRQHALVRQHSVFYWQTLWQNHIQALTDWALEYRVQQTVAAVIPLIVLTVIFYVNPVIGLGLLITLPVVPLFMILVGKGAATLHKKHFVALERLGSLFTDRLNALAMLATYNAHDKQAALLSDASENLNQRTMKVVSVAFLSNSVLDFFATLAVALVAVFIGFTLLGEINIGPEITLQQGLWILLTVPLLLSEMKKLGQVYHQKAQAEAAHEHLAPVLNFMPNQALGALANSPSDFNGMDATAFNVYECVGDVNSAQRDVAPPLNAITPLLHAHSLTIEKGGHILLSGKSGAGKTLLLEALAGQRPASHSLNSRVMWLTQHPVITAGSVRENLCLNDHFDDSVLKHILATVELGQWLSSLPYGLDTAMTDYPLLSGGEAQRLSLARVLLRDESVWLLDEPTAHLPDEQHQRLASLIYRLGKGKTLVWASHKALPADWFNRFWHVENGAVNTGVSTHEGN